MSPTVKYLLLPAYLPVMVFTIASPTNTQAQDEPGKWSFSSGIDYSSGDYGDADDTNILFIPNSISYQQDAWTGKISIPWLDIEGPGSVVGGGDGGTVINNGGERINASGLGDIWADLSYSIESFPSHWGYLDLIGKIKFPTADEKKGLGTGEFDYTIQADYFKSMGKITPLASIAYKIKGDPEGSNLNNVFFLSAGADYRINDTFNFGATIDFQEASTSSAEDALELFSYLGYRIAENSRLTFYTYTGFTDGSPDFGGGIQWKYSF